MNQFVSSKLISVLQILSDRAMVRVGGGWDSIEHFILKYDPCRQGVISMLCVWLVLGNIREFITNNFSIKLILNSDMYR